MAYSGPTTPEPTDEDMIDKIMGRCKGNASVGDGGKFTITVHSTKAAACVTSRLAAFQEEGWVARYSSQQNPHGTTFSGKLSR